VEVFAGALLLVGLFTRLGAVLLLVDIAVAIATTKIPMLVSKGFWATAHEARTDWSMFVGLIFLLVAGPGSRSLDARVTRRST
jgi:putative oxidoreductase